MTTPEPEVATPEERTAGRQEILEQQKGLAGPDLAEQRRIQRQDLLRQVAQQTFKNLGSPVGLAQVGSQAQTAGSQLPVAQQAQAGEMALQTEAMAGDVALSKQEQRAKQTQAAATEAQNKLALEVARRAFDLGYNSKQLALHANSAVSDIAFQQMYKDLQEGRLTKKEIEQYHRGLKREVAAISRDADILLRDAMQEFDHYIEQGNAKRAEERIITALNRYKEALTMAAKASNTAAIIGGVFTTAGTIAGAIYGGPAGAAIGAQSGKVAGGVAGQMLS